MPKRSVDKRVLNILLEAVRGAVGHLRQYNKALMKEGVDAPSGMARMLNGGRRLQDRLMKAAQNYRSPQTIELDDDEANVLASFVAYRLADVETYLETCEADSKERDWLADRRDTLIWLAHRLMTRELERVPHEQRIDREFASVLGLIRYRPDPAADHSSLIPPSREKMREEGMHAIGLVPKHAHGQGMQGGKLQVYSGLNELVTQAERFRPPQDEEPTADAGHASPPAPFEVEQLHDYKLRMFAKKDIEEYARAQASDDLRLCLQSLGALIETVLLDHFLPKRDKFALGTPPPNWDFVKLAEELLGTSASSKDGLILNRLVHMGEWLRPSRQLLEPIVLTRGMHMEARDLLGRILKAAGLQDADAEVGHLDEDPADAKGPRKQSTGGGLWRATKRD